MMLSRTTQVLLGIAGLLAIVAFFPTDKNSSESLPSLPAINRDDVTKIMLTKSGESIILERDGEGWDITSPLKADADSVSIKSLLMVFRKEVPVDLRVDKGNLKEYGLDDNTGVHFEVFTNSQDPYVSFVVGQDVPGGSNLIRLAGSDDVYRARVGGFFRYAKPATEWRDKTLLNLDYDQISSVSLIRTDQTLQFERQLTGNLTPEGKQEFGDWRLVNDYRFPVDQKGFAAMVKGWSLARASEIHASDFGVGWETPNATIEMSLLNGETHKMSFLDSDQSSLAKVDSRSDVFRVASTHLNRIVQPLINFKDKTLFNFTRDEVDWFALEQGNHKVRIKQDLGTNMWKVVEPLTMDPDIRQVFHSINTLSELRASSIAEISLKEANLESPKLKFEIALLNGSSLFLHIGSGYKDEAGAIYFYARVNMGDTVYVLKSDVVETIQKAFLK